MEDYEQLRSFGIIITGEKTEFLEARIVRENYALLYVVGTATIPGELENSVHLARAIALHILFKRRVDEYLQMLCVWQAKKISG
jgi:hypothetical protein